MTTAEEYPTQRVDVRVLFGKYLPRHSIAIDLVGSTRLDDPPAWPAGRTFLRRAFGGRMAALWGDLCQELTLLRRARQGYDGIIVRDKPALGLIGLVAARLAGVPFVYWMSFPMAEMWSELAGRDDVGIARRLYARVRGWVSCAVLYRMLLNRTDHLFVQSRVMHEELKAKGLRHDRVTPVPMGADLDAGDEVADTVPAYPEFVGRRVAVYLGTMDRIRQPEVLVDAALIVARSIPDFLLVLIGDAEEPLDRGWMRRYASERDADSHCLVLGRLPFEQGQSVARQAEIGLSPFPRTRLLESASPTKAVEYMSLGLAVIGNDQPDQAEAILGSGAGLCVELNAAAFAAAIVDLLSRPDELARMRAAGRPWVARHRSYRMLSDIVATDLKSLIQRRASSGAASARLPAGRDREGAR